MKVSSLVDNVALDGFLFEHGLSLFIELDDGYKLLFDMGQTDLFSNNAQRLHLSIEDVDAGIISHGHSDHAGGLSSFLKLNKKAKVYLQKDAFGRHFSLRDSCLVDIGIHPDLESNPRLEPCKNVKKIRQDITIFSQVQGSWFLPPGNRLLFGPSVNTPDDFSHEQNLVIEQGNQVILFAGCAHRGIVNIINKVQEVIGKTPTHVFSGMHLLKNGLSPELENVYIDSLARKLLEFESCSYFTMHCTGKKYFDRMKSIMADRVHYLSAGCIVEL